MANQEYQNKGKDFRNPIFWENAFERLIHPDDYKEYTPERASESETSDNPSQLLNNDVPVASASWGGIGWKTMFLLLVTIASSVAFWEAGKHSSEEVSFALVIVSSFLYVGTGIAVYCQPQSAPLVGPLHAVIQGAALGIGAAILHKYSFPLLMMATVYSMAISSYFLYSSGFLASVGDDAIRVIAMVVACAFLLGISYIACRLSGVAPDWLNSFTLMDGVFSTALAFLGAFFYTCDYRCVSYAISERAPKSVEWYCAFGLLVSVIWPSFGLSSAMRGSIQ